MSGNLFGKAFQVMTFGESHGPYIGLVIDGVKPGIPIEVEDIQKELDRRRPGQSDIVTPRKETDQVEIISGIFEGKTTGTPLTMLIRNQDQRSKDYQKLKNILRPGHASYTFLKKYGVFDYRGGGRASGRETATRVAAGAVAKQFLSQRGIQIIAYTKQISDIQIESIDYKQIEQNAVRAPDESAAERMIQAINRAKEEGDSLGGVIEIVVKNSPVGLGEPVFHKLEADLAQGLMSIGAVKAFEMGSGFDAANMKGSEHNDSCYFDKTENRIRTRTNNSGGVVGGITNGENLIMRVAVKPPSSINKSQETVDLSGNPVTFEVGGRHDPCICPRVVPVAEAMAALVLIDHILLQERISENDSLQNLREKIDTIDVQLLLLLSKRRHLIGEIAEIKKSKNIEIDDPEREQEVREKWHKLATELEIPSDVVERLINIVFDHSKNTQKDLLK